jgi:hypothetical protein
VKEIFGRLRGVLLAIFVVCCLGVGSPVSGEDLGFIVTWSGAALGNGASATGRITIDDLILLNPGQNDTSINSFVVDFTMTVSGASSGNGTFGLADFDRIVLQTGPGAPGDLPLDLSQELVGQDTGTDPWGTQSAGGGGGDFNVFAADPGVPNGQIFFEVCTEGGTGDCMRLVSFTPVGEHSAWLKIKVQTKGMEFTGSTLLGKAKAKATCYWYLAWKDFDPDDGTFYCETTPGVWVPVGGAGVVAEDEKNQLLAGSCGLRTATGSAVGAGYFSMSRKTEVDGALKSAKVRSLGGALTGTLDSVSTYFGDCKLNGSKVSESKVPAELLAIVP